MSNETKKKFFVEFPNLTKFLSTQGEEIVAEYREIVRRLECEGRLSMPLGEKLNGENLFVIRVINAGNIRVFYVYGRGKNIYGIHGYVKKTQTIPQPVLKYVRKMARELKQARLI